ncbi:MAG: D-TA family PLP-dependent enzyme [Mariniblastus sp.]|nr:D-TA family PLP-dependent enzyme [Mariniblastus sp.]
MPYPNISVYDIQNIDQIKSPGMLVFRDLVEHNLNEMIRLAGSPQRLRPHCKTHKIREIIEMEMGLGITRHKCATIAEAEMLADAGVEDILLAYQLVGPNLKRMADLIDKHPSKKFACLVDCPAAVNQLSAAMRAENATRQVGVLLDLDSGMNRTGISIGQDAIELYEMILSTEGLELGGLHWYDGHHRQPDLDQRIGNVTAGWNQLIRFRDQLLLNGLKVPRIVTAGTGSFSILAETGEPDLELSPGTTVFHDDDMATRFPELNLFPSLGILTRVVSCNRDDHLTLDVGHKSCAADQPFGRRLAFPQLGSFENNDFQEVIHSEEHLVIKTPHADKFKLGDTLVAIPRHACPVSAVHQFANVISGGQWVGQWDVAARDRVLTV